MIKFAIIAEIRSGYQLLATSLHSHPQCTCFGEIFGSDKAIRGLSLRKQPIPPIEQDEDPIRYLNTRVYPTNRKSKAVGFKLNYVCARSTKWSGLWDHMKDGWKIIHLTRANLLDRLLSQKLAMQEKNWQIGLYESSVEITFDELDMNTKRSLKWQQETREFFKDCPVLELEYNDIANSFTKVQKFLELPPRKLKTDMKKQRVGGQSKFIKNYQELFQACRQEKKHTEFFNYISLL